MSRPRLGLRALLLATCEAWDQVEGPSLGAAVLAIVRERPRLRVIIDDMREGIESLKARLATAEEYSTTLDTARREDREILTANNVALTASKKQEQILKDCLADIRLQRDRAEIEVDRLSTALAQSDAAANTLLTGLEDCRHALADMTSERNNLRASLTVMEAEVARLQVHKNAKDKPYPQPGDVVPWDEVEDKCLYYDRGAPGCCFLACTDGRSAWLFGPDDGDIMELLHGTYGSTDRPRKTTYAEAAVLVARDLGSAPEAWRAAMREWTANGNRPSVDPKPLSYAVTSREDAT